MKTDQKFTETKEVESLVDYISKLRQRSEDGLVTIISVNRELTIWAVSNTYQPKPRLIRAFYNDCYVVSIDGKLKATLRCNENPASNVVIYEQK